MTWHWNPSDVEHDTTFVYSPSMPGNELSTVYQWLAERLNPSQWTVVPGRMLDRPGIVWGFESSADPEIVMLFKLKWGGV